MTTLLRRPSGSIMVPSLVCLALATSLSAREPDAVPPPLTHAEEVQIRQWDRLREAHPMLFRRALEAKPHVKQLYDRLETVETYRKEQEEALRRAAILASGAPERPPSPGPAPGADGQVPGDAAAGVAVMEAPEVDVGDGQRARGRGGVGYFPPWPEAARLPLATPDPAAPEVAGTPASPPGGTTAAPPNATAGERDNDRAVGRVAQP